MTGSAIVVDEEGLWPELPWRAWEPTVSTLHMWTQVVGKVRMALAPPLNHWWHTTLYVTSRGLTTSPIPYRDRMFQVDFDDLGGIVTEALTAASAAEVRSRFEAEAGSRAD